MRHYRIGEPSLSPPKRFPLLASFWERYGTAALAATAAVCAGFGSAILSEHAVTGGFLVFLGAIATAGAAILSTKRQKDFLQLKERWGRDRKASIEHAEAIRKDLETLVRRIAQENNWWNSDCRVTVYGHEANRFLPLVRMSYNPHLSQPGRRSYPEDQGYIAEIWQRGFFSFTYPLPNSKEAKLERMVKINLERFSVPEQVTRSFRMLPTSIIGLRIDTANDKPLGLILIESEDSDLDKQADRQRLKESLSIQLLTTFIHSSISQLNSLKAPERSSSSSPDSASNKSQL